MAIFSLGIEVHSTQGGFIIKNIYNILSLESWDVSMVIIYYVDIAIICNIFSGAFTLKGGPRGLYYEISPSPYSPVEPNPWAPHSVLGRDGISHKIGYVIFSRIS